MTIMTPDFSLHGNVALITGGSRGLGRAMAFGFAAAGADVIVVSRKADDCIAVAEHIRTTYHTRAWAFPCHVGHWTEVDQLVGQVYETAGKVDILVNNAGMSPRYSRIVDITEELYTKVMAVNLGGPFRLTALIGPRMVEQGSGVILNISSVAAARPDPANLPYSAAKAGLNAITVGFAREYGPAVRVNAIMAGPFQTDIMRAWDPGFRDRIENAQALARLGRPDEIVGAALYLCSPAASYTTGATLNVDGGMP
jgi:NAD(P)-dependent dehydrogenase (short-subunit alcohol dehydrogenase family)